LHSCTQAFSLLFAPGSFRVLPRYVRSRDPRSVTWIVLPDCARVAVLPLIRLYTGRARTAALILIAFGRCVLRFFVAPRFGNAAFG